MQAQATKRRPFKLPARPTGRWTAVAAAAAILAAGGTAAASAASAATPGSSAEAARTLTYYAFDINNNTTTDPGFVAVPGTNPKVFAQGDEFIINDQLTTTTKVNGGYPIVGYDSGVCTLTRIPERHASQTLANCAVTLVWRAGRITVQGVVAFRSGRPQPTVLAVTGGTGPFDGAAGTVSASFTSDFKILTIRLK